MSDPEEPGVTRPPSGGIDRLARLADNLQEVAQALREEWLRTDEARQALAQVLAERQDQRDLAQRRLEGAEARLAQLEAQHEEGQKAREQQAAERAQLDEQLRESTARVEELQRNLEGQRAQAQEERAALEKQLAEERERAEELTGRLTQAETSAAPAADPALEQRAAELEAALEAERQRAAELAERLSAGNRELNELREAFERERQTLTTERNDARQAAVAADELRARAEEAGRQRAEAETARAQAARENEDLRMQVEGLMRQADGERAGWQAERAGIAAERYQALSEAAQLRTRVEELEARPQAGETPDATTPAVDVAPLEEELAAGRVRLQQLDQELAEARARVTQSEQALAGSQSLLATNEDLLTRLSDEIATLKAERSLLNEKLDAAEQGRQTAEAERERARAETSPLWGTIESLQRQIRVEREQAEAQVAASAPSSALKTELDGLRAQLGERTSEMEDAGRRALDAEAALRALRERWEALQRPLRSALGAWHRTPFVPPTLRVWLDAVAERVEEDGAAAARRAPHPTRLLLLDRDPLSLEPLANDLEQHGAHVLVAHYADEASLFVKTPEARTLTAIVADVMAFKSDQDMIERFKLWHVDLPQAALVVSYRADNAIEAGRARQLPGSLQAVHVARTIGREALLDMLARRPAPKPDGGSGVFKLFKR